MEIEKSQMPVQIVSNIHCLKPSEQTLDKIIVVFIILYF